MKRICLVCNAHLDLVWQWEWEEGLAEALSTFRIAADFCEEYDGFVFNHNESILYEWVEEYEPALFQRIQRLVREGKWHIMGGWYIQPDCNLPTGESIIRQVSTGRHYFRDKFGKVPTTAINFDSFGHSKGLVQILKRSGYDSYLICRPDPSLFDPPAEDFNWVGYDGSMVATHLTSDYYNTFLGKAAQKIENNIGTHPDQENILVLWGIGNHGGGPSRLDMERIGQLQPKLKEQGYEVVHTTPEEYFAALDREKLPRYEKSLNPVMVGCYTSQVLVKQKHAALENMLYSTEKMLCAAELQTGMKAKWDEIHKAEQTLLFNEFHDVLPGSMVKRAEDASLRSLDYAMEILSKERMRAFMAFTAGIDRQPPENIPVLVFNPHPYPVRQVVECEFQLQDQNRSGTHTDFEVYVGGKKVPSQLEKEDSTIPIDWRKRIVIDAELEPFAVTPMYCHPVVLPSKPQPRQQEGQTIVMTGGDSRVCISRITGWIDSYTRGEAPVLEKDTGKLLVVRSSEDPWGMRVSEFREVIGEFTLADPVRAGRIAGLPHSLEPVRIIEDGAVRTVAEAIFTYEHSNAIVRYSMEKRTGRLQLKVTLQWNQPDLMVKLSMKPAFGESRCLGQDMFGVKETAPDARETVAQKWLMLAGRQEAVSVVNSGIYAHDWDGSELRITLLHSPAYCAHPVDDRVILPQDRFLHRIDTGERSFELTFLAGSREERISAVDREALTLNEQPFALSFYPGGLGKTVESGLRVADHRILLSAFTKVEADYLIRLYNPLAESCDTTITIPVTGEKQPLHFTPYEIKTLRLANGKVHEVLLDGAEIQ